jgi:cobalt-zinc-cadmium efflux system membrane fusion protein
MLRAYRENSMKKNMFGSVNSLPQFKPLTWLWGGLGLLAILGAGYVFSQTFEAALPEKIAPAPIIRTGVDEVQLTAGQVLELNVGPVGTQAFALRNEAIGNIDFNQDMAVQVFSPYQGRIGSLLVRAGDDVAAGQVLYTVQIPDLPAAASTLISAAGTLKVTGQTLRRAQALFETQSIPLKELQQNTADQQAAEAAYQAARKTLSLFGLVNKEIEEIEAKHKIDTEMPIRSPFAGRVTARAGAVGQLVQPGSGSAPLMVANLQTLWMVASVPESELASYKLGQAVRVKVSAYPESEFSGKITYIADVADAVTHRVAVRADVGNAKRLLKPQMLATFNITLGQPVSAVAVPANALAREGDGALSVWVTQEGMRFKRRTVEAGMMQNGMVQITRGLLAGEKIARDKALFLSNLYLITVN